MTPAERITAAIEKLERLRAESTRGEWVRGDRWHVAGVMPEMFGPGCCTHCAKGGVPTWVGWRSINGTRMLAHVHEGDVWWKYGVNAVREDGPVSVIVDTGEYGYMLDADAELVVTLHRTIDAQLDLLRTARGFYGAAITGPEVATLFAEHALALADAILGAES